MSFLLKWLRPETSARVGLRPHRTLELPLDFDAAYQSALEAIATTLGANVYSDDRQGRVIEAGFGLIGNERIRVSFEVADATRTSVRIEALFRAGSAVPDRSAAVEALAEALVKKS